MFERVKDSAKLFCEFQRLVDYRVRIYNFDANVAKLGGAI